MGSSDPFDTWQGGRFTNSIANQAYELPRSGRLDGCERMATGQNVFVFVVVFEDFLR